MDKTYLIEVEDITDDNIIMEILNYGTIDATLDNLNIFIVTAGEHAKIELSKIDGVISIEEDEKIRTKRI